MIKTKSLFLILLYLLSQSSFQNTQIEIDLDINDNENHFYLYSLEKKMDSQTEEFEKKFIAKNYNKIDIPNDIKNGFIKISIINSINQKKKFLSFPFEIKNSKKDANNKIKKEFNFFDDNIFLHEWDMLSNLSFFEDTLFIDLLVFEINFSKEDSDITEPFEIYFLDLNKKNDNNFEFCLFLLWEEYFTEITKKKLENCKIIQIDQKKINMEIFSVNYEKNDKSFKHFFIEDLNEKNYFYNSSKFLFSHSKNNFFDLNIKKDKIDIFFFEKKHLKYFVKFEIKFENDEIKFSLKNSNFEQNDVIKKNDIFEQKLYLKNKRNYEKIKLNVFSNELTLVKEKIFDSQSVFDGYIFCHINPNQSFNLKSNIEQNKNKYLILDLLISKKKYDSLYFNISYDFSNIIIQNKNGVNTNQNLNMAKPNEINDKKNIINYKKNDNKKNINNRNNDKKNDIINKKKVKEIDNNKIKIINKKNNEKKINNGDIEKKNIENKKINIQKKNETKTVVDNKKNAKKNLGFENEKENITKESDIKITLNDEKKEGSLLDCRVMNKFNSFLTPINSVVFSIKNYDSEKIIKTIEQKIISKQSFKINLEKIIFSEKMKCQVFLYKKTFEDKFRVDILFFDKSKLNERDYLVFKEGELFLKTNKKYFKKNLKELKNIGEEKIDHKKMIKKWTINITDKFSNSKKIILQEYFIKNSFIEKYDLYLVPSLFKFKNKTIFYKVNNYLQIIDIFITEENFLIKYKILQEKKGFNYLIDLMIIQKQQVSIYKCSTFFNYFNNNADIIANFYNLKGVKPTKLSLILISEKKKKINTGDNNINEKSEKSVILSERIYLIHSFVFAEETVCSLIINNQKEPLNLIFFKKTQKLDSYYFPILYKTNSILKINLIHFIKKNEIFEENTEKIIFKNTKNKKMNFFLYLNENKYGENDDFLPLIENSKINHISKIVENNDFFIVAIYFYDPEYSNHIIFSCIFDLNKEIHFFFKDFLFEKYDFDQKIVVKEKTENSQIEDKNLFDVFLDTYEFDDLKKEKYICDFNHNLSDHEYVQKNSFEYFLEEEKMNFNFIIEEIEEIEETEKLLLII